MTEYDHLFAAGLVLLSAMLALGAAPQKVDPAERWNFYRQAWLFGLVIGVLSLAVWHAGDRKLDDFGLESWAGDQPWLTAAAAAAWAVFLAFAVREIRDGFGRARLHAIYHKYKALMPATRRELWGSWGAAVSAGSSEEIAFRGFLLWYVASLAGPVGALLVTSLLFGIAHGYQRRFGVVFASAAGLILGTTYLVSGSLLLVIWMHSTYNIASFTVGKFLLTPPAVEPDRAPVSPA